MNHIGYYDAVEILGSFNDKLNEILELFKGLKESSVNPYEQIRLIKEKLRNYKSDIVLAVKLFTKNDTNEYTQDYLLPALSIAHGFLRELGVNRVTLNSYNTINSILLKVKHYIQRYYNNLIKI
ncbi:hypothetical protein [Sutcliffiella halmapala]|uniref:hypothetical protein n=1 Tax=Sutcliffiella halmapala TaxID=79882 RepID=UPI000994925F|nr:hypothetical protein [Sutcliffiella halmapala]